MAKAPYITANDIEEYLRLDEERKALNRKADDLEKQLRPIKAKFMEYVRAEEPKSLSAKRSGFVLAIHLAKSQPAWKDEFIKLAGEDAAEELRAKAPMRESLSIERVA